MTDITVERVAAVLAARAPLYRRKAPHYQTVMLRQLQRMWNRPSERLLDVGGGTGLIAEVMKDLLPVRDVVAIDVEDRFFDDLSVSTQVYDGVTLPFDDASFDAATINNVLHHVPVAARANLLKELRRVVNGPVYVKDHLSTSRLDDARLFALDVMGNLPFSGMVAARYLKRDEWLTLARDANFEITHMESGEYRSGVMAALFPNRLETAMRFDAIDLATSK